MNVTNNFGFDEASETENKGKYRWKIGDHLAYRYELLAYLGGGTYGEVLKARDHMLDKDVAIKVLNNYTSMYVHESLIRQFNQFQSEAHDGRI